MNPLAVLTIGLAILVISMLVVPRLGWQALERRRTIPAIPANLANRFDELLRQVQHHATMLKCMYMYTRRPDLFPDSEETWREFVNLMVALCERGYPIPPPKGRKILIALLYYLDADAVSSEDDLIIADAVKVLIQVLNRSGQG